jgi:hypothetical protein
LTLTPFISDILDKYTIFGTITKGEDEKLRKAGLTSKEKKGAGYI